MARILFVGLDHRHCALKSALQNLGHTVVSGDTTVLTGIDAVFCDGDDPDYRLNLKSLRATRPSVPVVVVTMVPDCRKWLDALEEGAADYCSSPFDSKQIEWILSGLPSPRFKNEARRYRFQAA